LAIQAQNETNTDADRANLDSEYQNLITEISRIATDTEFNTRKILNGDLAISTSDLGSGIAVGEGITSIKADGSVATGTYKLEFAVAIADPETPAKLTITSTTDATLTQTVDVEIPTDTSTTVYSFSTLGISVEINKDLDAAISANNEFTVSGGLSLHIGANADQKMNISIGNMSASSLGVSGIDIQTASSAADTLDKIDAAMETVSTQRANLGAAQNRLDHTIANLNTITENLTAAESRIRDVDMAKEIMEFTRTSILNQAAQVMLAQANQQPQGILQLLK